MPNCSMSRPPLVPEDFAMVYKKIYPAVQLVHLEKAPRYIEEEIQI